MSVARIGFVEMAMMFFLWIPALLLPIAGLWFLWRGVRALENIAAALRDRK